MSALSNGNTVAFGPGGHGGPPLPNDVPAGNQPAFSRLIGVGVGASAPREAGRGAGPRAPPISARRARWASYPSRASNASRRPSPTKLKLVTARVIITPGKIASHGAVLKYSCALLSMLPQLAVGG